MVAPSETTPLLAQGGSSSSAAADDFDSRFRRWKEAVRQRFRKGKQRQNDDPQWLISVFGGGSDSEQHAAAGKGEHSSPPTSSSAQIARDIQGVRQAIAEGVQPTMIQTGSSGSYFVKAIDAQTGKPVIKAVFKPSDEEPYGNLNPKRRFLRRYFWWAMGRPCLIPGFSAMSEAAASLLDDQLKLGLVPKTQLVNLSSPAFHYHYNDRRSWEEHGQPLPEKVGSFQSFLHGYTMASSFLRRNPFPTRPRSILERDLAAEQLTHRKMRKREKARLRKCGVRLKYFLLCRQGVGGDEERGVAVANGEVGETADGDEAAGREDDDDTFLWTADLLHSFRLELEKLVVFDYLCRNTDRGLDNFMVRHMRASEASGDRIKLGAIDNSLAWPIKHPDGIRDYPFGWLFLPMDIIGGPFHRSTKEHFLPLLASPKWWRETELEMRKLFEQDEHFSEKLFESQMAVFKGQGWNVVQALRSDDEGPIELCARQKKVVHQSTITVSKQEVFEFEGGKVPLQASVAVSDLVSRQPQPQAPQATAAPIGIASGKEASPPPSLGADVHPRSLPETSRIVLPDTPLRRPHQQPRPLELGSSLGIDVLKDLDRAARKTRRSQRPAFQKAVSGFDLGRKQPLHSPQQHRGSARSGVAAPHHHHRRGLSSNDVLSEAEDDDDLLDEDGGASMRGRSSPTPAAESRLAQSDYFASYAGTAAREPMQSIDSALAASRGDVSPVQQRGSYDSTPPAAAAAPRPTKNRRRMRSVGNWSLLSSDAGQGDEVTTPAAVAAVAGGVHVGNGGSGSGGGDSDEQIKVIVERIIDVDAQPWQSWLRA